MKAYYLLFALFALSALGDERLIKGTPVAPGTYKEVVRIVTGQSGCTASIVGPKVILTAAHCAATGATSKFQLDGVTYSAKMTRSSLYPGKDHDLNLGVLDKEVPAAVAPVNVYTGPLKAGDKIHILGYGCTQSGGGGGNDGVLREGDAEVTGFSNYDVVSSKGSALCFGDSGGPAMKFDPATGKYRQATVNSKGNITDTNYTTNLTSPESAAFFKKFAADNAVDICGVTKECGAPGPGPQPEVFVVENATFKAEVTDKKVHQAGFVKRAMEQVEMYLGTGQVPTFEPITVPDPLPIGTDPMSCQCQSGKFASCSNSRKTTLAWCGPADSCWCNP